MFILFILLNVLSIVCLYVTANDTGKSRIVGFWVTLFAILWTIFLFYTLVCRTGTGILLDKTDLQEGVTYTVEFIAENPNSGVNVVKINSKFYGIGIGYVIPPIFKIEKNDGKIIFVPILSTESARKAIPHDDLSITDNPANP